MNERRSRRRRIRKGGRPPTSRREEAGGKREEAGSLPTLPTAPADPHEILACFQNCVSINFLIFHSFIVIQARGKQDTNSAFCSSWPTSKGEILACFQNYLPSSTRTQFHAEQLTALTLWSVMSNIPWSKGQGLRCSDFWMGQRSRYVLLKFYIAQPSIFFANSDQF